MSNVNEEAPELDAFPVRSERRRVGRIEKVSPALILLMRGEAAPLFDDHLVSQDNLAPAIGIAVSVLLSGLVWLLIGCSLGFG